MPRGAGLPAARRPFAADKMPGGQPPDVMWRLWGGFTL